MISRSDLDRSGLKWRIVAKQRVQNFHLEKSHLAEIRFPYTRIRSRAQEIPIAFNSATTDKDCFGNLLHCSGGRRRNVDMQKPPVCPLRLAGAHSL